MKPKLICGECYEEFIPKNSKTFCDRCARLLDRDINQNYSVEDEINMRKFKTE